LCGVPLQPGEGVAALMPDPAATRPDLGMWGRHCQACMSLPYPIRLRKLMTIMRAMFPNFRPAGWR
jgi:hypothetical protein